MPGRKSLIWMSAGIPLQISSGTSRDGRDSQIGRATRLLTDANIAVYPIDTRGLRAPDPPRGGRGRLEQNLPPDVMLRLADGTGGRAFYFNNDLASSIRTAISDAEVSYTLGFYPSENGFDGKFHNLSVNVARKDVEVRHRSGYFAVKDEPPNEKERRSIMSELLSSPLDGSQIGLQAAVESVPTNAKAFRVLLRIETSDLHLERRNDRWAGTLDLAIRVESSKQKTVQVRSIPIDMAEEEFPCRADAGPGISRYRHHGPARRSGSHRAAGSRDRLRRFAVGSSRFEVASSVAAVCDRRQSSRSRAVIDRPYSSVGYYSFCFAASAVFSSAREPLKLIHHSAITFVAAIFENLITGLLPYRHCDCERLCICLRIVDGDFVAKRLRIHASEALDITGIRAHRRAAEAGRVWDDVGCFRQPAYCLPIGRAESSHVAGDASTRVRTAVERNDAGFMHHLVKDGHVSRRLDDMSFRSHRWSAE